MKYIRTSLALPKAARMFTDRGEPRDAFWNAYETVKEELNGKSRAHVLSYYGTGGVGKTHLLKKLESELKERIDSPKYIYVDLNVCQDRITVLERMRNALSSSYKFSFSLFEFGLYVYAKKIGEKAESIDVKQIITSSPVLSLLLQVSKELPFVGSAAKIIDIAAAALQISDKAASVILTRIKKHDKNLLLLDSLDTNKLLEYLPYLFALDMAENLEKKPTEPFVVFLDTYEKLVNRISALGDPLLADEWIRGENGLIQNIPYTLWVIAGREHLKWEDFDPEWNRSLEQHVLKNLSPEDSDAFLKSTGIDDEELRSQIFNLTGGSPNHLDLCVDTFLHLKEHLEEGIAPDITMFGNNTQTIVARLLSYMGNSDQDLAYALTCLYEWDDDLISEIAPGILPNFSFSAYEKIKDHSFVTLYSNGRYSIDRTVSEVLMNTCPALLKKNVGKVLFDKFSKILEEKECFSPDFSTALTYVTQAGILLCDDREQLNVFFGKNIYNNILALAEAGMFECANNIFNMLSKKAGKENDFFRKTILFANARLAQIKGDYKKAYEQAAESLKLQMELHPEIDVNTLRIVGTMASILSDSGDNEAAVEALEFVLEHRRKLLGEDDPATLNSLSNLAAFLYRAGKYRKALNTAQQAYEKRKKILGENNATTIRSIVTMANSLYCLGEYQQALELQQKAFETAKKSLGEDHTETLCVMSSLAYTLNKLDEPQKALELRKTVLEKRLRLLRKNHPHTISSMNDVATSLNRLGEYEEAADIFQKVYEARRSTFGEADAEALSALDSAANILYNNLKRPEEALPLFKTVLEKRRATLGSDTKELLRLMNNLAICYDRVDEKDKADSIRKEMKKLSEE